MGFKIGDKVRFLNEVGEGVVVGFDKNQVILVEDHNGFQIPMSSVELVVVDSDDQGSEVNVHQDDDVLVSLDLEDRIYLARHKVDADKHELHIINDCAYSLSYVLIGLANTDKTLLTGTLEPNLKEFLGVFSARFFEEFKAFVFQGYLFSNSKMKHMPPLNQEFSVNKLMTKLEVDNDYFDHKALLIPVLRLGLGDDQSSIIYLKDKWNEDVQKKSTSKIPKKELIELDLHMESLLDDHRAMTPKAMLEFQLQTFESTLIDAISNGATRRLIAIHGVGNGRLKQEITQILKDKYPNLEFQDASYREYGVGATMVRLRS